MKKTILLLATLIVFIGCTKVHLPHKKFVATIDGQGYCMEFISKDRVEFYKCDSNYNYADELSLTYFYTQERFSIAFDTKPSYKKKGYAYYIYKATVYKDEMSTSAKNNRGDENVVYFRRIKK